MKRSPYRVFLVAIVFLLFVRGAFAVAPTPSAPLTESLLGIYTGSYLGYEPLNVYNGIKLLLTTADPDGTVKGSATVYDGPCAGTYSMQGQYASQELGMQGSGGPCNPFGFRAKVDGSTRVGTVGGWRPLRLMK